MLEIHYRFVGIFILNMKRLTTDEFILKAQKVHGDKYDYSNVIYINMRGKIKIICNEHGLFEQCASSHIAARKTGCPKCGFRKRGIKLKITNDEFIKRCGDKIYNFEYLSKYKGADIPLKIKCLKHNIIYEQIPYVHISGEGCPKCSHELMGRSRMDDTEDFLRKAEKIHGNLYEYLSKYEKSNRKIQIMCKKHGIFSQRPNDHLQGQGCPRCAHHISSFEVEIQNILEEQGYGIETSNRKIIYPLELDIYIPSLQKAIEFNGIYWHYSEKYFVPGKHAQKSNLCREKGIQLLHIREDLWNQDKNKMKEVIIKFLNI